MKIRAIEMQQFLDSCNNASDIVRNEDGQLLSFSYIKYYGTSKHGSKKINVTIKSEKELAKTAAVYLDEKSFFNQLADNVGKIKSVDEKTKKNIYAISDIKLHCEKIYKYTLDGQKYKTDKSDTKKLFDFMPYADFRKVTRQRFWGNDGMLRNGYFSGLIGTNNDAIIKYKANSDEYDLFDVDFNAAYPYCFKMPLPTDRFYTLQEWETVKDKFTASMKFYQIKVKTILNPFGIFVPPPPYAEYRDFDFLMQKSNSNMIVSQQRLSLIRQVYGNAAFIIKREYICPIKVYLKLADLAERLYTDEKKAKADGDYILADGLKIARNSLVGNFGKRDECREIKCLRLIDSDPIKDVITVQWTDPKYKQQPNYLPLAMVINDITARRLFDIMTDENALRLCYNTDGGIVALRKGCRIVTSDKIGRLKAKQIFKPIFMYTTLLYNRPLIYDTVTKKTYNTKSIDYDEQRDRFIYSETIHLNTRNGFICYENSYPIVTEPYQNFNFRQQEIIARIATNKLFLRLQRKRKNKKINENELSKIFDKRYAEKLLSEQARNETEIEWLKECELAFEQLCNPYDELYNKNIRHAPKISEHIIYEQTTMFNEKFFKFDTKNR